MAAPKGVWRSVFYSAVFGWSVLLALTFAATHTKAIDAAGGTSQSIIETALTSAAAKAVLIISTVGQLFCGMACVTSASRMTFAFSRDGAVPGHNLWRRLNSHRTPTWAVVFVAVFAFIITIPAYKGNHAGLPVAFLAVTSISVIGLYIAYTIPVFLRWRMGDKFEPGPWTLGRKYKWINLIAIVWVALCVIIFCLPFTPAAVPWNSDFSWSAFNYAPLVTIIVMLAVTIWYYVSARHTFKGPVRTIEFAEDGVTARSTPSGRACLARRCWRSSSPPPRRCSQEIPRAGVAEVDAAVARAAAAFGPGGRSRRRSGRHACGPSREIVREHREELAAARGAQRRQADRRRPRRDGHGGPDVRLLRGLARAAARRHDPGRRRPGLDGARAAGRRRPDRAVELPADDRRLEAGAGAGRRQHGGAQAGRADAADRAALRRARA